MSAEQERTSATCVNSFEELDRTYDFAKVASHNDAIQSDSSAVVGAGDAQAAASNSAVPELGAVSTTVSLTAPPIPEEVEEEEEESSEAVLKLNKLRLITRLVTLIESMQGQREFCEYVAKHYQDYKLIWNDINNIMLNYDSNFEMKFAMILEAIDHKFRTCKETQVETVAMIDKLLQIFLYKRDSRFDCGDDTFSSGNSSDWETDFTDY